MSALTESLRAWRYMPAADPKELRQPHVCVLAADRIHHIDRQPPLVRYLGHDETDIPDKGTPT